MMNCACHYDKDFMSASASAWLISLMLILALNILLSAECYANGITNIQSFDYYSQEDGLPNNQIQCIFQDRKGWIWLGTSQGLSRFHGYRFINFLNDPEDTASL
jgi:ligand-binding sensor domain-containing protein